MKNSLYFSLLLSSALFGQSSGTFEQNFDPIRQQLVSWDKVRGEWLANSMLAMSNQQAVPDRQFPENFTPADMFSALPASTRQEVRTQLQENARTADDASKERWNAMNRFANRPGCSPVMGRSYGDPHLQSFDGAAFSFQTVGEFTLAKSQSGHMVVQVRQRNEGNDFSLNSAVAMWVAGDRVCLYANERPDGNTTTPLRIGGQAIYVEDRPYFLEHGGIITKDKNDYIVTWPTGERVKVDARGWNSTGFFNVAVEIFPCTDAYTGILGNANGSKKDDFETGNANGRAANLNMGVFDNNDAVSQTMEKEYLAFIAKDFASNWRITPPESLFDYGWGQSTASFTDETFPRVHRTVGDLATRDRDRARRDCERAGLTGADLNACIFDAGFLQLPPTPRPVLPTVASTNGTLPPVSNPRPNVNPGSKPVTSKPVEGVVSPQGTNADPLMPNSEKPVVGSKEGALPESDPNVPTSNPDKGLTNTPPVSKPVSNMPPIESDEPAKPINRFPQVTRNTNNGNVSSPGTSRPSAGGTRPSSGGGVSPSSGSSQPRPAPRQPSVSPGGGRIGTPTLKVGR